MPSRCLPCSKVACEHPDGLTSVDRFDNGTKLHLNIDLDPDTGSALFDFTGTGPQGWGNINCPSPTPP